MKPDPLIVGMFETFDKRIRLPLTAVEFPVEDGFGVKLRGAASFTTENLKALPPSIHKEAYKVGGWRLDGRFGVSGWQRWSSNEGGILAPDELRTPQGEAATFKLQFRFAGRTRHIADDFDPDHFTLWPTSEPLIPKPGTTFFPQHVRYNPEFYCVAREGDSFPSSWQLLSIRTEAVIPQPDRTDLKMDFASTFGKPFEFKVVGSNERID